MAHSIGDLLARQRQRVDALGREADRYMDRRTRAAFARLTGRMGRLADTAGSAPSHLIACHVEGHLERLVHEVSQLRLDDPATHARVAWAIADIEEAVRASVVDVLVSADVGPAAGTWPA